MSRPHASRAPAGRKLLLCWTRLDVPGAVPRSTLYNRTLPPRAQLAASLTAPPNKTKLIHPSHQFIHHKHPPQAMPQEPPPGALSSAFPPPPTYYTHFTEENLTALKSHRLEDGTPPAADSLPEPLCYLVPPPPPTGSYRAFGEEWMVPERYPSLEEAGIRQLYPPTSVAATAAANGGGGGVDKGKELTVDRTIELRRLSKSLLLNYLELVGVMGMAPEQVCSFSLPLSWGLRSQFICLHSFTKRPQT